MYHVKSFDRGSQARRGGGPHVKDMLGTHIAALARRSGAIRQPTASATMAEGADFHAVSHPLYVVQQAFMHTSAVGTKLAAHVASMRGELMCIARGAQDSRNTL